VEASALQAQAGLARSRISLGASLLRLRSDEQLVALFREGHDEAFQTIHDRYRQRLFAYTRQMLPGARQDAEDALQDVFVRAYSGLRANDRELTLRAWLYRVAHNRCVDELRRPMPPAPEVLGILRAPSRDPVLEAEQRESLRQLVQDVRQLPEQQRSALLMRELGGIAYSDIAGALGTSVAAVKSLLVRARLGLAQAAEARDTACSSIREELILAHDRGVRPSGLARRHMHECTACREFRGEIRGVSRQFAALIAPIGPLGMIANLLGFGGSGGAAAASGGASAGAGAAGAAAGGSAATAGAGFVAVGHVATLLAAAVVTAGGAMELQHSLSTPVRHTHHVRHVGTTPVASAAASPSAGASNSAPSGQTYPAVAAAARSASIASRPRTSSGKQAPRGTNLSSAVAQLTSAAENEAPTTGGNGVGAGDDGTTGDSTGTGSTTTDPGTTASTTPSTTSGILPSGGDSSTGNGSTSSGTGDGSDSPATPPVTSTSDPNATSSSAGGGSGSPTASGSSATSTGSAGGSSSGSDPNWPL
jgi:RNA polymerase sigma factor (sigma-70 family)